jgi:hypothetical protein
MLQENWYEICHGHGDDTLWSAVRSIRVRPVGSSFAGLSFYKQIAPQTWHGRSGMMNERIKQLETKAWGQVNRTNGLVRTEDFNQKFAELIVKECYALVDYENKQFIKAQFKEHFGVEE